MVRNCHKRFIKKWFHSLQGSRAVSETWAILKRENKTSPGRSEEKATRKEWMTVMNAIEVQSRQLKLLWNYCIILSSHNLHHACYACCKKIALYTAPSQNRKEDLFYTSLWHVDKCQPKTPILILLGKINILYTRWHFICAALLLIIIEYLHITTAIWSGLEIAFKIFLKHFINIHCQWRSIE